MKGRCRTSVVIPCYSDDRFLSETLASVARQSKEVLEIIVIDDGSPAPLCAPQHWDGPELKWIRTKNQGLGAARNEGLKRAGGEFVAFVDADDLWHEDKILHQELLLDSEPNAVACYTRCVISEGFYAFGPYPDPMLSRLKLAAHLWTSLFFPPSSVLIRRDVAIAVQGFREGLANGEDLDMWYRLLSKGEIFGVPLPLTWYRVHSGQISANDYRKVFGAKEARRGIIENYSDLLISGGLELESLWDAYRQNILTVFFRRNFSDARPMLWDYWRDHPGDLRVMMYGIVSCIPPSFVAWLRD